MRVTLLGTGEATGMPVPLCECRYCANAPRRRRSGLLVETETETILFDVSPDVREQLRRADVDDLDAVFITHHHTDHVGGIEDLAPALAVTDFQFYMTRTAQEHFEEEIPHLAAHLEPDEIDHGDRVSVGDSAVVPFPVDHARPEFDTLGFALHREGTKVVFAPDMERFLPEREAGDAYENADLLVAEGSGLLGPEGAGTPEQVRANLDGANAERTVLTHFNEHIAEKSTERCREIVADAGYELGSDFDTYLL